MNSPDVIFIRIIPDFTIGVEISRRSKVDEVACAADVNYFASCCTGLLTRDDCGDGLGGEGVAGVDGDVVLCADSFDFFEVREVAGDNSVNIQCGFEVRVGASDVSRYLPVWMGLLEGSSVGS